MTGRLPYARPELTKEQEERRLIAGSQYRCAAARSYWSLNLFLHNVF
jgi:hypothetical protein